MKRFRAISDAQVAKRWRRGNTAEAIKSVIRYLLSIATCFCLLTYSSGQQTVPRSNSEPIQVMMTAVDKSGRISKLRQPEVGLTLDGKPQVISDFQIQINAPTSVAVMLDTSFSQKRLVPLTKSTARVFAKGYIRPGRDRVAIISFADEVQIRQALTDDVELLRSSIDKIESGPPRVVDVSAGKLPPPPTTVATTGLLDAVVFACDRVLSGPDGTRKAIILFTDGIDSSSSSKTRDAIESAVKKDVAIYTIGLPGSFKEKSRTFLPEDREKLRRLSQETGGRAYFPAVNEELEIILSQIEQDLRAQYLITFLPQPGQYKERRLKIEVISPERKGENIQLAYRRSY